MLLSLCLCWWYSCPENWIVADFEDHSIYWCINKNTTYHFFVSGSHSYLPSEIHTLYISWVVHYQQKDKWLFCKETAVPCQWGSEILKFGIKQLYKGLISTVKRFHDLHWWRANACNVNFVISSWRDFDPCRLVWKRILAATKGIGRMFSTNFCDSNYLFLILVLFSLIDTGVLLLIKWLKTQLFQSIKFL